MEHYVYELVDKGNGKVFYVGKGTGERPYSHEKEASGDNNNAKIDKIREIGDNLIIRVIGRYKTECEAFAVESTLIHWVYGYDNLTNYQSGHGQKTIREKGNDKPIEGIDIFMAGTYSQRREAERDNNDIENYMLEVKNFIEENLKLKLSNLDLSNPKWTYLAFTLDKIKISIGTNNSTRNKALFIHIAPINGSKEYRNLIEKICEVSLFECRNYGNYAKMNNYKLLYNVEEVASTFIELLKELNKSLDILVPLEIDLNIKKDFENIKNIIIHILNDCKKL